MANRPLEGCIPSCSLMRCARIRSDGTVKNRAVYLALGVAPDGTRRAGPVDRTDRERSSG